MFDAYFVTLSRLEPPSERWAVLHNELMEQIPTIQGYNELIQQKIIVIPIELRSHETAIRQSLGQLATASKVILDRLKSAQFQNSEDVSRFFEDVHGSIQDIKSISSKLTTIAGQVGLSTLDDFRTLSPVTKSAQAAAALVEATTNPDWIPPLYITEWITVREKVKRLVGEADFAAFPYLLDATKNPSVSIRIEAIYLLRDLDHPDVVPVILELVSDPAPQVRQSAISSLAMKPNADNDLVVSTLIRALSDESAEVRRWSIHHLGRRKDRRALEPLISCLDDEECRGWAASALAEMPDERALAPLLSVLEEVSAKANRDLGQSRYYLPISGIIEALEAIGGPEVEQALSQL